MSSLRRHYPDQVYESKALESAPGAFIPRLSSQLGNTKLPGLSNHPIRQPRQRQPTDVGLSNQESSGCRRAVSAGAVGLLQGAPGAFDGA